MDIMAWILGAMMVSICDSYGAADEKRRTGVAESDFIILDMDTHGNLQDLDPGECGHDGFDGDCGEW